MQFDNIESAEKAYKDYAYDMGFSVRIGQQQIDVNGVIKWKLYLCARAGYR